MKPDNTPDCLRDDATLAKSGEEIEEAVVGGLVVEEAKLSALAHIGDDFDRAAQIGVGVPGRDQDGEVGFDEIMFFGDAFPDGGGVGELLLQRCDFTTPWGGCDAEPAGEAGPHPAPAEDVAVNHVECLVATRWAGGSPFQMAREEAGVSHVGEAVPLRCRAGEEEGTTGLAADGRVCGEGDAHIHRVAEGVTDDGVGAMNAPGKTSAGGSGEDFVFLGVVEVLNVQAALLLAERGSRETTFAVRLEWAEVVLETCDERYVANRAGPGDNIQKVAHHGGIDSDVFRFSGLTKPGSEEDVGRVLIGESGSKGGGIEEVGRDGLDAAEIWGGTAGKAEDAPVMGREESCEVVADDAGDAGDECSLQHSFPRTVVILG